MIIGCGYMMEVLQILNLLYIYFVIVEFILEVGWGHGDELKNIKLNTFTNFRLYWFIKAPDTLSASSS